MFSFKKDRRIFSLNHSLEEANKKISLLEKEYNSLKIILEGMAEAVIAIDKDSRIVSVNPSAEKIFSISGINTKGKLFLEAIPNNDIFELINKAFAQNQFISEELTLVWPFQKTFQINASPIFEQGRVAGCLVVVHDITEIRKLEVVRRDFVANVSHELKTPLTSIKGFIETLLDGAMDDKENCRHFLEIIQNHTNRLDALVNDLLSLSRLEVKEISLVKKEFDLKTLVDDILSGFNAQLKKKSLQADNQLAGTLIKADKNRMHQVLTNLIDNAIKFNREKGSFKIYAQGLGDKIKVVIEDSGIGIPPKDLPRIFERFYRVDKARSRELGGTGLGLSIVKHIIELHGGSVGVESTEGLGSKFWFTLPK